MRNGESLTLRSGVLHSAEPWRAQLPIVAILLLVCVAIGCQRDDATQKATTPKRVAGETDAAEQELKQPATLTERQREVLRLIEAAGGATDRTGDMAPTLVDLASDRVFADDALVRSMVEFPELRRLRLAAANTQPDAFRSLESLSQLTELFLQDAPLVDEDLIRILAATPKLERLTLRRLTGGSDAILPSLAKCQHLKVLALIEMNDVSGATLSELPSIETLRVLDLRNCGQLTGDDFKHVLKLDRLVELKLGGPAINDGVLRIVAQHPGLTSLTVEDAEVTGLCLELLAAESALANRLRALAFARCFGIDDDALAVLPQFPRLESLTLRNLFVTGAFLAPLRESQQGPPPLKTLIVTSGFLSDDSVASLPDLFPNLTRLDFRVNSGISDTSLAIFDKLTNLRELRLEETGVTDPAAAAKR